MAAPFLDVPAHTPLGMQRPDQFLGQTLGAGWSRHSMGGPAYQLMRLPGQAQCSLRNRGLVGSRMAEALPAEWLLPPHEPRLASPSVLPHSYGNLPLPCSAASDARARGLASWSPAQLLQCSSSSRSDLRESWTQACAHTPLPMGIRSPRVPKNVDEPAEVSLCLASLGHGAVA